jgi:hypothetical protein
MSHVTAKASQNMFFGASSEGTQITSANSAKNSMGYLRFNFMLNVEKGCC